MKQLNLTLEEQITFYNLMFKNAIKWDTEVKFDYKQQQSEAVIQQDIKFRDLSNKIYEYLKEVTGEIMIIENPF